ncbi:MAG: histidinol dehydrogenase, partial [Nitratireductor sp.]|nr:histidinol dehydrogenase [Nitratireductor sp.]
MVTRLDSSAPGFEARFSEVLAMKREISEDVDATVRAIIADVRSRGDAAVLDYTNRFDRLDLTASGLAFSSAEIDAALASVPA